MLPNYSLQEEWLQAHHEELLRQAEQQRPWHICLETAKAWHDSWLENWASSWLHSARARPQLEPEREQAVSIVKPCRTPGKEASSPEDDPSGEATNPRTASLRRQGLDEENRNEA